MGDVHEQRGELAVMIKWSRKARSRMVREIVPREVNIFLVKGIGKTHWTANGPRIREWTAVGPVAKRRVFFRATGPESIHVSINEPFVCTVPETAMYDFHVHDQQGNFLMSIFGGLPGMAGSQVKLR